MTVPERPDRTTTQLIWDGVEAPLETVRALQPPWPIPGRVGIRADIGHHHHGPEVVEHSIRCLEAGASAVHLHIRDADGADTGDLDLWREAVTRIRAHDPDVMIDSGLRGSTLQERLAHIEEGLFDIVPLLATWDPSYLAVPLRAMRERGVRPEICVWDGTDIATAATGLIASGHLELPAMWLIVPGTPYYGLPMPSPTLMVRGAMHLMEQIQAVDPGAHISFSAAGRASSYLTTLGMMLGHHVRPGIGETPWRWPHSDAPSDDPAVLIADAVTVARALGREPASPAEYRAMLGLRR